MLRSLTAPVAVSCAVRLVLTFMACLLTFSLLKIASYAISPDAMERSLAETARVLYDEGDYWRLVDDDPATQVDNWGAGIIFNIAGHGQGAYDAFLDPIYTVPASPDNEGRVQAQALLDSVGLHEGTNADDGGSWSNYARYWQGQSVILRPLLVLFDITQIRIIMLALAALLMASLCAMLVRVRKPSAMLIIAPFFAVNAFVSLISIVNSFPLLIALAGCLAVIAHLSEDGAIRPEKLFDWPFWAVLFFLIGAITAYLDLLGSPIVSLGVPLALLVYLGSDSIGRSTALRTAGLLALCAGCWAVGYGSLWIAKWIISSLVTGIDFVGEGFSHASVRTSVDTLGAAASGNATRMGAISANVSVLASPAVRAGGIIALVAFIVAAYIRKTRVSSVNWWAIGALFLLALLPPVWYALTPNHAAIHFWFTYRSQAVSLCAAILSGLLVLRSTRNNRGASH